jgi:aspartate/methionine/tyrosine aminotransferase
MATTDIAARARTAIRASTFTESVIREMTRVANQHGAINLAQGFPDFGMPEPMKDAACAAIHGDINQYAITWGSPALRLAIAEKYKKWYGMDVDPEKEITVCCGATEAMASVFLALIDPGDEVIIFAPYYENYGPDAILAGAKPVFVNLEGLDWQFDPDKLRKAFNNKTRAIIVNTPHNPTGRVFTRAELDLIAELCQEHDVIAITDEIYEHIIYAGSHHVLATWPGMRERTITISGLSKTFSCTGWRLGYAISPPEMSSPIRKVHDFLTVGAPAPLQAAGAVGMAFDADYYNHIALEYRERREIMVKALEGSGFKFSAPEGAYYILADFSAISTKESKQFAVWLAEEVGVATVPGMSFYQPPSLGKHLTRFAFCKKKETLEKAAERLGTLSSNGS